MKIFFYLWRCASFLGGGALFSIWRFQETGFCDWSLKDWIFLHGQGILSLIFVTFVVLNKFRMERFSNKKKNSVHAKIKLSNHCSLKCVNPVVSLKLWNYRRDTDTRLNRHPNVKMCPIIGSVEKRARNVRNNYVISIFFIVFLPTLS